MLFCAGEKTRTHTCERNNDRNEPPKLKLERLQYVLKAAVVEKTFNQPNKLLQTQYP